MIKKLTDFFKNGLWREPPASRNALIKIMIRQLRSITVAVNGFSKDKVGLRASALTLYTLLSVVPILAMALGITKGFGLDLVFKDYLKEHLSHHQEVVNEVIRFADNMLANLQGGFIAGIGFIMLIWAVIKILGNIEAAFNHIWRIEKSRDFLHKITNYLSLAIIAPVFIVVSSSMKVKLILDYIENTVIISYFAPVIRIGFWSLSYSLIWFLFVLLYLVLTNTRIKIQSAAYGGVIAGTLFHLLQWSYFMLQGYFSGYGAIYGSFAALPLFLIWLQYSWLIVLWGAELAFAHQYQDLLTREKNTTGMSLYDKRLLALLVCREVVLNFENAVSAETAAQIAGKIKAPLGLINECIDWLHSAGIFTEIVSKNGAESTYQPALPTDRLSAGLVIDKLDKTGRDRSLYKYSEVSKTLSDIISSFYEDVKTSPNNKLLREL